MPLKTPYTFHRRWIWYVLLPILAVLLLWAGDTIFHAARLYQDFRQVQSLADQGLTKQTAAEALILLGDAHEHTASIKTNLSPLLPLLDWIGRGPDPLKSAAQVSPLLTYAESGLRAADLVGQSLAPVLALLSKDGAQAPALEMAVSEMGQAQAKIYGAGLALQEAQSARQQIQLDLLPEKARAAISKVDSLLPLAQGGLALLANLPQIAGSTQPQTYLLAAQNNDELRPTGGFLSALGLITLQSGKITTFSMQDSFAVDDYSKDYPYPPEPIQRFMLAGYWVPRDANWFPDFPTSAKKLQELYELSTGIQTSGVIAFDQSAVAALLQELGPLQIEGMSEPLASSNAVEWMRQAWSPQPGKGVDVNWWKQRKNFIGLVGKTLIAQISALKDISKTTAVLGAGVQMIHQGHLQVFLNLPEAQAGLAQAGLDGSVLPPPDSDFLMLVDSNIGFNKVDAHIQRASEYRLDLSDPTSPKAAYKASYKNLASQPVECLHQASYGKDYAELEQRCYWDYWRVLTPPGSLLTSSHSPAVPSSWLLNKEDWPGQVTSQPGESGLNEFSSLLVLKTASNGGFELAWTLPAGILRRTPSGWDYHLRLQKQAGLASISVKIELLPPAGCQVANSQSWKLTNGAWTWSQKLTETEQLEVQFRCP